MNPALVLIGTYLLVAIGLQLVGFGISRAVDLVAPSFSLLVFLVIFIGCFALAWPIAVFITQPKTAEGRLRNDLLVLRSNGFIQDFSVENERGGLSVKITSRTDNPNNLRHMVAEALGGVIPESRIMVVPYGPPP